MKKTPKIGVTLLETVFLLSRQNILHYLVFEFFSKEELTTTTCQSRETRPLEIFLKKN
jgi:hypothetical protein